MKRITFKAATEAAAREQADAWIAAQGNTLASHEIDVVTKAAEGDIPERFIVSVEYEPR